MVRAYVLIEMAAGYSRDLVNALRGQEGIRNADRVTGPYDVIVELEAASVDSLSEAVSNKIHTVSGVVRTITCVCVG
jgi:DNA-binding Lrp family transcriptional regulator